jgi:hypothetical protein
VRRRPRSLRRYPRSPGSRNPSAGARIREQVPAEEHQLYYTSPELVDEVLRTTVLPQVLEALTADGSTREAPLVNEGNGMRW